MFFSYYSLKKSKKIFYQLAEIYHTKKRKLSSESLEPFRQELVEFKKALQEKNKKKASDLAKNLQEKALRLFPKPTWKKGLYWLYSIVFALSVATLVRQEWFEFYKIPSGSMRPTLKEGDLVAVSKSAYSINFPLKNSHLYFKEELFPRGSICIFSGENLDISDNHTLYFFLFPGIKQYVKRLIAKPGDLLYFYGGLIYGMDAQGKDVPSLRSSDWAQKIEHIPFLHFEGKVRRDKNSLYLYQMNEPLAKITEMGPFSQGSLLGPYKNLSDYGQIWGIDNFGMVRLFTSEEISDYYPQKNLEKTSFYLEITHHPSLQRQSKGLSFETSILAVTDQQWKRIEDHLFTSRFHIKNHKMYRYGLSFEQAKRYTLLPNAPINIPDGTYEWQDGTAYEIHTGDIAKKLPKNHPIYQKDKKWLQTLFNLGVEVDTRYSIHNKDPRFLPSRFVYFRNKDLYLFGHPVFLQNESTLQTFVEKEEALASALSYYQPFIDSGPPLKEDGSLDKEFLKKYGLKVPENMYLVLGDNYSLSADSRVFGFVPQGNFKGKASLIFWPFGPRMGSLMQPRTPIATIPHFVIWGAFVIIAIVASIYYKKKRRRLEEL